MEGEAILMTVVTINKLIEIGIREYEQSGKIPTYEELEARNLTTDLKIEKLMKE